MISVGGISIVVKKGVISLLVVHYKNFTGPYETSQVVNGTLPSTTSNQVNIIYSHCLFLYFKMPTLPHGIMYRCVVIC